MPNSQSNCSRRTFLEAALVGAGGFLLDGTNAARARTAVRSNVAADTASEDLTLLSIQEVSKLVREKKGFPC
jgi:hypothetical protein